MKVPKLLPVFFLAITILLFFYPVSLFGKLPIPADNIIGLYHPFRDFYAKDYPNGIPFKNSLITDPVRQQFPWRYYSLILEQYRTFPLWNPYNSAGSPLLANFQSAVFYPLNLFLFLPDFSVWWSLLIIFQPLLSGIFMYLYLKELKLNIYSCFLGGFVYAFCGFSIAWMEWGTIGHVMLWLPLALLSIDRIFYSGRNLGQNLEFRIRHKGTTFYEGSQNSKLKIQSFYWPLIFIFSICSAFFAGHLQTFFYLYLVTIVYFIARWYQAGMVKKEMFIFLLLNFCFLILTAIQWLPTLQFILHSARDVDHVSFQNDGWFLPVQNLAQFVAPDFFGNPSTLNYWGVWNYGEFVGYVGIAPLILGLFALFYRYDKKTLFFGSLFFLSLIFALPTWFAKIPFLLNIPFISSSQPSRLLFLTDFSFAVLAGIGLDYFIYFKKSKKIFFPFIFIFLVFFGLWVFVVFGRNLFSGISEANLEIARKNLIFPSAILLITGLAFFLYSFVKTKKLQTLFILIILVITVFDLFRFGGKFIAFSNKEYLYPDTASTYLVRKLSGYSRVMSVDPRILPPNFSIMYFIQTLDGYDPLYLRRYGELIAAMERNYPNIDPPFGFNRIINPHNYESRIADLLGVKYVLSLNELSSQKLKRIFHEGETKVYENKDAFDRAFFVSRIYKSKSKQGSINAMFDMGINLKDTAIVEKWNGQIQFQPEAVKASIALYKSDQVIIDAENKNEGFLILTDSFYPTWHAKICGERYNNCVETKIYLADYNFRGVIVPGGKHKVIFENKLL